MTTGANSLGRLVHANFSISSAGREKTRFFPKKRDFSAKKRDFRSEKRAFLRKTFMSAKNTPEALPRPRKMHLASASAYGRLRTLND